MSVFLKLVEVIFSGRLQQSNKEVDEKVGADRDNSHKHAHSNIIQLRLRFLIVNKMIRIIEP